VGRAPFAGVAELSLHLIHPWSCELGYRICQKRGSFSMEWRKRRGLLAKVRQPMVHHKLWLTRLSHLAWEVLAYNVPCVVDADRNCMLASC
jgi:hypothetical protein